MGVRYDDTMLIKIPVTIKQSAMEKAEKDGKTLSSYVRDLIVKDIKKD